MLKCTTRYQHSHTTSRDCIAWHLASVTLPRLLTLPSKPYLRNTGHLPVPILVAPTHPYRTLSYTILLFPTIPYPISTTPHQNQDQDQASLLVTRRNDNHSLGPVIRELVLSSHQRSELSNTILCIFSR